MHGRICGVEGMQTIFLEFFDIGFVPYYKGANFTVLKVRTVVKPLNKNILTAAEFRLHAVPIYGKNAVGAFRIRRGVDIHRFAFIIKFRGIAGAGSKPSFIISKRAQIRTILIGLYVMQGIDKIINNMLMTGIKILIARDQKLLTCSIVYCRIFALEEIIESRATSSCGKY